MTVSDSKCCIDFHAAVFLQLIIVHSTISQLVRFNTTKICKPGMLVESSRVFEKWGIAK